MIDKNDNSQFSLIITNLTSQQQAIVARQDKLENILNGQQVLLATLVEQHRSHEDDMKTFADAIQDLHEGLNENSKATLLLSSQMAIVKLVGSSVLTLVIGYLFAHFVK